jgi:hypothetical protein
MRSSPRVPLAARPRTLAVVAVLGFPISALAQIDRAAPIVLVYSGGTRGAAMADAMLGARDDEALFYSPGQLAVARGASASWLGMNGSMNQRTVAAAFQVGSLGVAIGARHLDFRAHALPLTAEDVADREGEAGTSVALSFGAGRTIKGFRVGAGLTYGEDRLGSTRLGRNSADVGVAKPVGPVVVAVAAQNLWPGSNAGVSTHSPTRVSLGFNGDGYPLFRWFDLSGGAALSVDRDGRIGARTGWELAWAWIEGYALAVRAGVRRPDWTGESPITVGLGLLVHDNYSIDFAHEPSGDLGASYRVGVRVR